MTLINDYIDSTGKTQTDRASYREAADAVNADALANFDDPAWRRARAQEMTTRIDEGFEFENILQLFSEVENADFNGRITISEVRGLRAHWVARGGIIEESTLRRDVMELDRDSIGFHVSESEEKLKVNFAETQSTLLQYGAIRLDATVNLRALAVFQEAIPIGSPYYVPVASLSLAALNTALREVRDESKADDIVIIGRATMTDQIVDTIMGASLNGAGYLPQTNEELIQRGILGRYKNATIITLKNHKDDIDQSNFPANELYVIGRDASKFAFWGGLMFKEWIGHNAWYWHYMTKRDFGGVVHRPERARRIVDSNVTP